MVHSSRIYSSLKPFLFPTHLKTISDGELAAPVHIRIKPLNACNHRCWFCAYRAEDLSLGEEMKLRDKILPSKMDEIVDDLIEMQVKAVTFSGGGEPLLYPYIVPTIQRLANGGIKIGALTNGSYLKGEVAEAFATHGTWVRISMDGWDSQSYVKFRTVKETEFSAIMKNIENFNLKNSKCMLGVSFIINKFNASHIYEFCSLIKSVGIKNIKLSSCVVSNSGKENNEYHSQFKQTVFQQIELCRSLESSEFEIIDHYHSLSECFDKSYEWCPSLRFLTIIGADCGVYTCQDKAYTPVGLLGSIRDVRFKELWFSEKNKRRILEFNPKIECKHHCVSHRKNLVIDEFISLDRSHGVFV